MSDKNPVVSQIVAQFEQLEALSSSVAIVMSSYYKEMLKQGVPEEMAFILTRDFHATWWKSQFGGKNEPGS